MIGHKAASADARGDDSSEGSAESFGLRDQPPSRPRSHRALTRKPRFPEQMQQSTRGSFIHGGRQDSSSDLHQLGSPPLTPRQTIPFSLTTPSATWLPEQRDSSLSTSPGQFATPLRSQESLWPLYPDAPQGILKKDWVKDGSIAQLQTRDDYGFMPSWKRYAYYLAPFLAVATLALYWLYFALRIRFTIAAQNKVRATFPMAWLFIAVEISVAVPVFLQSFWSIFILKKRNRPRLRLVGNDVPTVDVLVTCCGEDIDLILDTTRAACDVDYPQGRFRVVVLDDGRSENLERAIYGLQDIYPNLHYRSREKIPGVPHHYKAGNLNYGLDEVHNMPGGASQFVAALDADMIPEQEWLRAIMPHLLIDEKMALACPPQLFYNIPASDPLCQTLDFFVHVSEPIKDALGVAWCTGSGYVVRRDALDEIGQFPLGSLAEDVATSTLLLGKGWKTAYIHESLQFGTVPDTYGGHIKQRTRWAIGTVDTALKLNFCLWGSNIRHLTLMQRLSSFVYALLSIFNVFLTLSLFAMPVVLISNKAMVAYATDEQLRWLIRSCFAAFVSNRLCEIALYLPSGYATGQRGARAQLWMAPYVAFTIVRSFLLPKWLGGRVQAFKPSGSLKSQLNERDPIIRAPVFTRLRVILFNYLAWFHISYVYFCVAAIILSSYRCILDTKLKERLICLLTHAGWPPMAWIIVISAFWIPISYACDPPDMPDREELLIRDPKTGIAHPTPESKKIAFRPETVLFEVEYCLATAFTALVFGAAFFY